MTVVVPCPDPNDLPFNDPFRTRLDPGTRLTVTFEPDQRSTEFRCPILAITKHPEMHYIAKADGTKRFEADAPPTDPDDMTVTFMPCLSFRQELKVIVENLSGSNTRDVIVQPVGWEEVE